MKNNLTDLSAILVYCFVATISSISTAGVIDFSTDEDGTPLVNGQDIRSPDEFGDVVSISTNLGNLGAAIFDSDPTGPNVGILLSDDMLVNLGNILIIQNPNSPTQTIPGIFDQPSESTSGGTFIFEFAAPSSVKSIDLIDIDDVGGANAVLTDTRGNMRTYTVPQDWTFDLSESGPNGFDTLDLTTLAVQVGEGGASATAVEDAGFNPNAVSKFAVTIFRSGGIDNLNFVVPEPGHSSVIMIAAMAVMLLRRPKR